MKIAASAMRPIVSRIFPVACRDASVIFPKFPQRLVYWLISESRYCFMMGQVKMPDMGGYRWGVGRKKALLELEQEQRAGV